MNLLQKLFGGSAKPTQRYYNFSVKCNRCGEVIDWSRGLEQRPER